MGTSLLFQISFMRIRKALTEDQKRRQREKQRLWAFSNRRRLNEAQRRHRKKHPDSGAQSRWKSKYGVTPEWFREHAKNGCEICGATENIATRGTNSRRLAIDHDHSTDAPRGVLCHKCNSILGMAVDDETLLLKAVDYLKARKHETTTGASIDHRGSSDLFRL